MTKNTDPTHFAYTVKEGKDGKNIYIKLGAGWEHQKGFNLQLDANPIDGRLTVFKREGKSDEYGDLDEAF